VRQPGRLMHRMSKTIAIVTPVLDDWASFTALVGEIACSPTGSGAVLHVYAVDDGSSEPFEPAAELLPPHSCIASIEVIRLAANLGHQRAIAVGLCAVVEDETADAVLVMDADGQDRPADIEALLAAGAQHPQHVVLAARAQRAEPRPFRLWYWLYRLLFWALTGQAINFGNFCLIPMTAARRLVHMPELWNNLAAAVMRSRLPYMTVPTVRATRSCGNSKMNLSALIIHGLSAMSVYSDVIFVRVLLAAGGIAVLAALGIVAVAVIRIATNRAIPGWATTAAGDLMIILLQTLILVLATSLMMLAGRSSRPLVPIHDCAGFVIARQSRRRRQPKPVMSLARPVA
jgi:polyisoprenyl-phosphate glycosyltransferase